MKEFKNYHPLVNFIYFLAVITFAMLIMHPAYVAVSLGCSFIYSVLLKGRCAIRFNLLVILPIILFLGAVNPLFNHEGVTILGYLPSDNPLTLESILYGLCAGSVLGSVICWFSCYNEIMTSDKFVYLFGRIMPSLSLLFSMSLRFVPRFKHQFRQVALAQKSMGHNVFEGNLIKRMKSGLSILSVMVTWSLENAVETADSMKSRGYGMPGRTAFSLFKWSVRDGFALLLLGFLACVLLIATIFGFINVQYFPFISMAEPSVFSVVMLLCYGLLCTMPMVLEAREAKKWR